MLSIAIALFAAAAVSGGIKALFPHSTWSLLFPFLVVFVGGAAFLLRRVGRRIEPLVKDAERHLVGGRREMALKSLESGLPWQRWHPLIGGQLKAQIGALHYDAGKFEEAEEALKHASRWPWTGKALLACTYFKRRAPDEKMVRAFESAVRSGDKEPLSWTVYAYCLLARGKREEAQKVLERALKKNPNDERLKANLELAREGKKLKTAPYGDKWSRFGLDGDGPVLPRAARGFAVRPGFRQKARSKK
jgi:tetratricopeptide (TPR) repeat protein